MEHIRKEKPTLVVIDSLQHAAKLLSSENGKHKYSNYEEIIKDLYTWKDETQSIVILIVQLNGSGKVEGPASTIFNVDCPINLVANPKTGERYMETEKNRMGPTGRIFYDFVSDNRCIEFLTKEQVELKRTSLCLPEFINKSIESYLEALSTLPNYKSFIKKLKAEYKAIYENSNSDIEVTTKTLIAIQELIHMLK
jgi:hypothetical protein